MFGLRSIGRRTVLGVTAVLLLLATAVGPLTQVTEAACQSPSIAFGRWMWCGYWLNRFDWEGDSVRIGGVPSSVNSAEEFITMIKNDLASGNANHVTGASFVIQTMIGSPLPNPSQGYRSTTTPRPPTAAQRAEWERRVRSYANYSTSGNTQYGTNGRVEWWARQHLACGSYNTYWQGNMTGSNPNDVAPYVMDSTNSSCRNSAVMDDVIIFRDARGNELYKIRRDCMNPLGTLRELSDQPAVNFVLDPGVGLTIRDNGTPVPGTVAEVGDQVTFTYSVSNSGPTPSTNANCSVTGRTYAGYQNVAAGGPLGGTAVGGVATGCPRAFAVGNTVLGTEVINLTSANANQTICRQVEVSPQSPTNAAAVREVVCVKVASKPYSRVFGGDVAVGNGFETTPGSCTTNNASAVGWNRRASNGFNGAGTRHAVYAIDAIFDYATGQNSSGAATPKGLAFGNATSNVANGWFGGNLGSAGCITDYFAKRPTANQPWKNNVSSMSDGSGGIYYSAASAVLTGGVINNNSRVSVYINGDLHITSNIRYSNNFNVSSMPLFQVVVRGNIYIENDVTELDGVYIAQPASSTKGIIYTCANTTPYSIPSLTASNYYTTCRNKLTVRGSFVAREVALMRTFGSQKNSAAGESIGSHNAGEAFEYGPAFWLQQPRGGPSGSTYDSITSLPPIL